MSGNHVIFIFCFRKLNWCVLIEGSHFSEDSCFPHFCFSNNYIQKYVHSKLVLSNRNLEILSRNYLQFYWGHPKDTEIKRDIILWETCWESIKKMYDLTIFIYRLRAHSWGAYDTKNSHNVDKIHVLLLSFCVTPLIVNCYFLDESHICLYNFIGLIKV